MISSRWRVIAGVVALIGTGAGQLAQFVVAPAHLSGGSAADQVAAVADHGSRMQLAVWLDIPILLIIPAALYLGHLAGALRSRLAATGAALMFGSALGCGYLLATDLLVYLASRAKDRDGAVALVADLQASALFGVIVLVGVLGTAIGLVLLGIALVRAKTVPSWAGVLLAAGPVLAFVGEAGGSFAVATTAYALEFAGYTACAVSLVRLYRRDTVAPTVMTPVAV